MIQNKEEKAKKLISFKSNLDARSNKSSFLKKWNTIKKSFLELSQEVNCECFPKIFEEGSHIINKLIWAFLFVIFTALTCWLCMQNVLDYLRLVFMSKMIFKDLS